MEQLIQEITIGIYNIINHKEKIDKMKEDKNGLDKAEEEKDKLEREIDDKKTALLEKLNYYFSVIDESEKQFLTDRKKQFLESNLKLILELIEQVNDKFNLDNIEKMGKFLSEKNSKISKERDKKISDINRKWITYQKYYNKCVETINTTENEEIKEILDKIIIILRRNMEIVSNEYTIIKNENIQNYIEMIKERKSGKVRDVKEKIAEISGADIESSNENLEIQNEKNKKLYKDDAKKLRELIYILGALIESTQNENSQERIALLKHITLQDDIELQNDMEVQAYIEFQEDLEAQKDMELQDGTDMEVKEYMEFQEYINSQRDMDLQGNIETQEGIKSQRDTELSEYSELQEKLKLEKDLELQQYLELQEYYRVQESLKSQEDLEQQDNGSPKKNIFLGIKEKVNGALDKVKKIFKRKKEIDKNKKTFKRKKGKDIFRKFTTDSEEEGIEDNAGGTLDVNIEKIITDSKDVDNIPVKAENIVAGEENEKVCERVGDDIQKNIADIIEKYKKMMEEGIGAEGEQSSDLNPSGSSNTDINR